MKPKRFLNPEAFGLALEAAVRLGLVSSSAVALAVGQIALAIVLALVALGMFLRFWRLRRRRGK